MLGGNTEDLQKLAIILGIGGFLGYLIANKYNKSKTLGVVLGAGVTLGSMYAFHLNVRDIFSGKTNSVIAKKNMDCQKKWDSKPDIDKGMIGDVRNKRQKYFMYNCVNDIKPQIIIN